MATKVVKIKLKKKKTMIKSYKIFCDNCKKIIAVITIYPEGENMENSRPCFKVLGLNWICNSVIYHFNKAELTKDSLLYIAELIKKKKFRELKQVDNSDTFGFFCRNCGKNYCSSCWQDIIPIIDDSLLYDYTLAACPARHRQIIDD